MRPRLALAVPLLALATACGSNQAPPGTPSRAAEPSATAEAPAAPASAEPAEAASAAPLTDSRGRPMSQDVLDRIGGLTDCAALQAEFDQADANGHVGYMEAADTRMQEVGCY